MCKGMKVRGEPLVKKRSHSSSFLIQDLLMALQCWDPGLGFGHAFQPLSSDLHAFTDYALLAGPSLCSSWVKFLKTIFVSILPL